MKTMFFVCFVFPTPRSMHFNL